MLYGIWSTDPGDGYYGVMYRMRSTRGFLDYVEYMVNWEVQRSHRVIVTLNEVLDRMYELMDAPKPLFDPLYVGWRIDEPIDIDF